MEKGKQIRQEQQPKIEEVVDEEESKNQTILPIVEDKLGVYSGSKKCPNVCMIWKDQIGVIC
jgi:hypothetical protein